MLDIYSANGISDAQVQFSEVDETGTTAVIKSETLTQEQYSAIIDSFKSDYDPNLVENRFNTVGPSISQSVTQSALLAIAYCRAGGHHLHHHRFPRNRTLLPLWRLRHHRHAA